MSTPLSIVKDRFGDKDKLVEAVAGLMTDELWLPRLSSDRGRSKGLKNVSNAKLLHLHEVLSTAKEQFGTRQKLIDAVLELESRSKDAGYRTRLEAFPVPRLMDLFRAGKKRAASKAKG